MTTPREDHPGAKTALRERLRAARRGQDGDERAAVEAGLARAALAAAPLLALPPAAAVALYASRPREPGTRALRAALAARGLVVVLPVVVGPDRPLAWAVDPGVDDTDDGDGGRPRPGGLDGVDVVLLPALAVDGSGTRLGQGGGHYDRTLALLPRPARPLLVGVVRDEELLAAGSLPREAHDVAVDAVLTPTGWHDLVITTPRGPARR